MVSQVWPQEGTQEDTGGTQENKVCNKLCPMRKEATMQSNREGQETEGAGVREKSRPETLLGQER